MSFFFLTNFFFYFTINVLLADQRLFCYSNFFNDISLQRMNHCFFFVTLFHVIFEIFTMFRRNY